MRLRKNILCRSISDICCFLLCFTFIPITFVFEMIVVVPEIHDTSGWFYRIIWIVGVFLVISITSNYIACILVDTSIRAELLRPPVEPALRKYWHFCSECESLVPPRSWHCQTCRTCILKREHHCLFTACCIGHRNYRFFFYFIIFMAIGSALCTLYNSVYFWWIHADTYRSSFTVLKMILPMLMLTVDLSWNNFYLLIYELNIIAFCYSTVMIVSHIQNIYIGATSFEGASSKYDLGWRRNAEMVFGKRMHLAWLSPFVKSDLPHDGLHWETILQQVAKNR